MKTFGLVSKVWWRAQGIYCLLHVAGIILGFVASLFSKEANDAAGFLLMVGLFSCGSALVCGVPAWIAYALVAQPVALPAGRLRMFFPVVLVLGLAATWTALYLGFEVVFDGALGSGNQGFVGVLSAAAYISMFISVLTMRRSIVRRSEELAHPETSEMPTPSTLEMSPSQNPENRCP